MAMQQALRNLIGPQHADSIQSLSQSLQQQFLGARGSAGDGPGHRRGNVSGEFKFHFGLHFEPRSEGGGLCQTGVLVASATPQPGSESTMPLTCRWKRRIGTHLIDIPGIHASMYHTSADDIGMDIVCEAEVAGNPGMGRAYGVLGPFELDPITRMSLENLIASGQSSFPARQFRNEDDQQPRDLQIRVTQEFVKVVHPGDRDASEMVAPYSADYPKVVIHPTDTCKFRLELSEDTEKSYRFQALSRTSRDLIALLIRCFHSRKYIATSFILSRLFQDPATPGAPFISFQAFQAQVFDIHGLGDRLGKEFARIVGQLEVVERVVRNATAEKIELQAQLRETINSYTEAIEDMHQQLAAGQNKSGPGVALQLQLHEARSQHSQLQLDLQEMRQRVDEEQQRAPKGADSGNASELEAVQAEIKQMRSQLGTMQGDSAAISRRDPIRQEELRHLRADVDMLNSEKEGLENNNNHADKEKTELIENFLYVKGCLDKLQMASLQTPAASPEHERQVAQLKANFAQVVEERNRLAVRVESLDRDRERQKQHRESALERFMNANARLLEERDRLEKEKNRVAELYQRTMGSMGAVSQPGAVASAAGAVAGAAGVAEGRCDQAQLEAMRRQAAQKTEELAKRAKEGESLRQRLRKLAMVGSS